MKLDCYILVVVVVVAAVFVVEQWSQNLISCVVTYYFTRITALTSNHSITNRLLIFVLVVQNKLTTPRQRVYTKKGL